MNLISKKKNSICSILLLVLALLIFMGCEKADKWEDSLYTPTMIQKIDDTYFIIDCWHHRIIYNDNLMEEISEWYTLTDEIKGGHSIASDGELCLVDDTDNSLIRVFAKNDNGFTEIQTVENVNGRPHFIMYDDNTKYFYAISSETGKIWILQNNNRQIDIVNFITIDPLTSAYTRSFNIIDGYLYTVSGNGYINKINYIDMSFEIEESYQVPDDLHGMNFIEKIDNYFYISAYTNKNGEIKPQFIRVKDLNTLQYNNYEDIYETFGFNGTPYYISGLDNKYFITEIDASSGVKSFEIEDDEITNIKTLYYFEGCGESSLERKGSK